jgi:phosphoglycolate phosphatase
MTHDFQLIVFDYDGTLVDSQDMIVRAMCEGFTAHGMTPPEAEAIRRVVGLSLEQAIAEILPRPGNTATAAHIAKSYRHAYFAQRTGSDYSEPLFPGVREVLTNLDRGEVRLGIATGKSRRGLMASLERHGLKERFATLQTADTAAGKPNPDMLIQAMGEAGAAPGETVLIGDTTFDMEMAGNAGVAAIGVAWGYHEPGELTAAGAAVIVDAAQDIPTALSSLSVKQARP